jgi:chemotaxis protein histidine kinase CheA/ActR/RegA family two-component response regulator
MSSNLDKFAILESFLDEVNSYLPEIEAHLDQLQQHPANFEAIEEAYRRAHTIAGSAAMMDFYALSRVAQGMEEVLGGAIDQHEGLDAPTIALLRRSFSRLTRLVEHIRTGADDAPVLAEDEVDRASLRSPIASGGIAPFAPSDPSGQPAPPPAAMAGVGRQATQPEIPVPDWLAAFGGPAALAGSGPVAPPQASAPRPQAPGMDPWAASLADLPTGHTPAMPAAPHTDPFARSQAGQGVGAQPSVEDMLQAFQIGEAPPPPGGPNDLSTLGTGRMPSAQRAGPGALNTSGTQPASMQDLVAEAEVARRQVASLRDVAIVLRDAAKTLEEERTELRAFLDGSRDALDRLEEWAGQQMGLDLRQSPDSVRRYLPLSVIWVITTRLKTLVGVVNNSSRNLTGKQEEIEETLGELRRTLQAAGQIFSGMASMGPSPDNGFSATVAQLSWAPPAAPATQPPVGAAAPLPELSAAARAELERDVREQLRRELEDEVRTEVAASVRRDEEDRIRQELQIQVRRQLLAELTPGLGMAGMLGQEPGLAQMLLSTERAPKPVQITSEQSPEALEIFRDEAQEHLQTITEGIRQLEAAPGDTAVLQSIRRAMHTLKGAAGMMGFAAIQRLAHASEDLLDRLVAGTIAFSALVLSLLLETSDELDQMVSSGGGTDEAAYPAVRELVRRYAVLTGAPVHTSGELGLAAAGTHDAVRIDMADDADDGREARAAGEAPDLSVRLQLSKLDDLVNVFGELLINRSILEERIDRLSRIVGDTVQVSDRLHDVGAQLESRFEAATLPSGRSGPQLAAGGREAPSARGGGLSRLIGGRRGESAPHTNEFDELELDRYTEFHRLSRGLSEGVTDVGTLAHEMEAIIREAQSSFQRESRLSTDVQDRLLKARLVPLQSLMPRLYRVARASASREDKEIEFFAEGTSTEVDRKVAEEVAGPLLHIVRNAVNHGIERPSDREKADKPRSGKILISAGYEGNQVVISVHDDGRGIDPEKIRATAIARGWIDAYAHISDKEAINLIFQPGVSTAETITEESGRGVGLDVVRDAVARLRGTIEVDSTVGQGSTFTMKFPISLQIARAVLVRVSGQTLAVPMAVVDQIGRLDYYQKMADPTPSIEMRGERYPLAYLAGYLRLQPGPVEERSPVLLVNAGKRRVALLVDAIVAQQEIVSKPLGPHLRDVPGVAGAAVLGNGQVVLILELHGLLAQQPRGTVVLPIPGTRPNLAGSATSSSTLPLEAAGPRSSPAATDVSQSLTMPPAPASGARGPFVVSSRTGESSQHHIVTPASGRQSYVLVVDDSPSVRRVVGNMLKANGWEVQTARDGVEALDLIARQVPAAVLLDIEMPRMDGYELLATVRSQDQYRHLPLIVLTSRAATKHQQRALQLGADAYVIKPYQDEELLTTIATLVQARSA